MIDRTLAAGLAWLLMLLSPIASAALPIEHWTTARGTRVYFVRADSIPMLDVNIDFDAGSRHDPAGKDGLASMTAGMLARGKGSLVFISSLAGTAGFPGMAVYAGSKAGINNFAASARVELRDTPVNVTLMAAGPVDTEMWDRLEEEDWSAPILRRFNMLHLLPKKSPELMARRTVAAVKANRRHVRVPRRLSVTYWLGEAPRRIAEWLLVGVKWDPRG
jgi:NAD(P)-dependent dehydrogenase (short-subunit alcohol dehydrogenase family)